MTRLPTNQALFSEANTCLPAAVDPTRTAQAPQHKAGANKMPARVVMVLPVMEASTQREANTQQVCVERRRSQCKESKIQRQLQQAAEGGRPC